MNFKTLKACFGEQMRKYKLKNLSDLSYETKIPLRDLENLFDKRGIDDKGFDLLNKLKDFFGCRLSTMITESEMVFFSGNSYEAINGVVYFIKNTETGLTKIGYTRDLLGRVTNLSYEHKAPMEVVHYISSYDSANLEQLMHSLYKEKRIEGEWFDLLDVDLEKIKRHTAPTVSPE